MEELVLFQVVPELQAVHPVLADAVAAEVIPEPAAQVATAVQA